MDDQTRIDIERQIQILQEGIAKGLLNSASLSSRIAGNEAKQDVVALKIAEEDEQHARAKYKAAEMRVKKAAARVANNILVPPYVKDKPMTAKEEKAAERKAKQQEAQDRLKLAKAEWHLKTAKAPKDVPSKDLTEAEWHLNAATASEDVSSQNLTLEPQYQTEEEWIESLKRA